ncbi:MAG: hypothetical protein LC674_00950, partial [Actinobacteria bacterium]|nr:hypothetical protein [Actinomycetota bacterium]
LYIIDTTQRIGQPANTDATISNCKRLSRKGETTGVRVRPGQPISQADATNFAAQLSRERIAVSSLTVFDSG